MVSTVHDFEKPILESLVKSYRASKKDTGEAELRRVTKITPEKLYRKYKDNDGDFETIKALEGCAEDLEQRGFVQIRREKYGSGITAILLNDDTVQEIEGYLGNKYGVISKDAVLQEMQRIYDKYASTSPLCMDYCLKLRERIQKRQAVQDTAETERVLKAVAFIENNRETLYIREASCRIFSGEGSKVLEEPALLRKICAVLQNGKKAEGDRKTGEVLERYHIIYEPKKISLKGDIVLEINGSGMEIKGLLDGIELHTSDIGRIDHIRIRSGKFMTVENRTSYLRHPSDDYALFDLAGFSNRWEREFLKKCMRTTLTLPISISGISTPEGSGFTKISGKSQGSRFSCTACRRKSFPMRLFGRICCR